VAHLVNENAGGDSKAVAPAENADVEGDEKEEAEEEFKFESEKKYGLELEQEQSEWAERSEFLDPVGRGCFLRLRLWAGRGAETLGLG
jgi:hypothetical protein